MRSGLTGSQIYIALVLSAAAAIFSFPHQGSAFQEIQSLLRMVIEVDATELAGSVGSDTQAAIPP